MTFNGIPILEYDPSPSAIIQPGRRGWDLVLPDRWVMTWFADVVQAYAESSDAQIVAINRWETGVINCYETELRGRRVGFEHTHVGARRIIACGGCGVLDHSLALGHILVPTSAVRDVDHGCLLPGNPGQSRETTAGGLRGR